MDGQCRVNDRCLYAKWQWFVVPCTMYVKDIKVLMSQVGSLMKVRMSTPDQSIYKQVWSLGPQQEFEMPLLHTFITTDQHRSNFDIVFKFASSSSWRGNQLNNINHRAHASNNK